ncbi:MAG: hypothetical protein J6T14_00300 [Clostridia bacterium]|nr:hypothetical protein [Clostridia bacterium]MBP5273214.1 hypothetical protein [Clostridia bacterium]MBP5459034.1 hypothetical protein [Clostridia bacterium]
MTGVLAAGEGAALAGLITYFLILLIPVLLCIFGIIELRKKTPDGKRVGRAMFILAGIVLLTIIGFFVVTALF